ncbi:MAG: membrane protein insertase YidC [Deltaproteobacteria bacterium]|nr:membrane protein insertase YidC [Deltaproteobacteria bacterium]
MNQEMKSLLAVGLSVAVFILWYNYIAPKPQQKPAAVATSETPAVDGNKPDLNQVSKAVSAAPLAGGEDPQAQIPVKETLFESDLYKVVLTNDGGIPISWQMNKFKKNGGFVNMASVGATPLKETLSFAALPAKPRYKIIEESENHIVYLWKSNSIEITKRYQFDPKSYLMNLSWSVKNLGKEALSGKLTTEWPLVVHSEKKSMFSFLKGPQNQFNPVYFMDGKVHNDRIAGKVGRLFWAGVEDRYFISAMVPRESVETTSVTSNFEKIDDGSQLLKTSIDVPIGPILPGSEATSQFGVYVGPKEMESLKISGAYLEKAINYGWFSFIAVPILHLLRFFYGLIKNYGVAIIILTIFAKLLMHPLSRHSMKSMKAMQALQPKLKELREKYKNDKERLNMETMHLFRAHKVNPMGGCLPMLIQLPIYIALYKVLWNSIELYRAPFFWFYRDLSAPDPYFITPVVLGVFMWLQQKMTPSASADPAQAKMMQIMPIMFTAFMLFLPSGLVLYILVNTATGVLQQWMTNNDVRVRDLLRGRIRSF